MKESEERDAILVWLQSKQCREQLNLTENDVEQNLGMEPTLKEFTAILKEALALGLDDVAISVTPHPSRPPFNAEYLLFLILRKEERDVVIGDLVEGYGLIIERFSKRHADIWFYKQVAGSLCPLLRRTLLRIGALVWLGRILRRLIS